jgi:hypothetical protein
MSDTMTDRQQEIVDRAAGRIKAEHRRDFRKYVEDILRARRHPPLNIDVRYACGAGIVKYGRRK